MTTRITASAFRQVFILVGLCLASTTYASSALTPITSSTRRTEIRGENRPVARSLTISTDHNISDIEAGADVEFPPRDRGRGNLRWSASDANGISDNVAISENGNIIAIGYTLNDERLEVRNAFAGDTLFRFPVASGNSSVAVSAAGDIIAYSALDSVWLFRSNGRGVPFFRFGMEGFYPGPVALSAAGDRLIATGNDPEGEINRAWAFNTANGQRLWTLEVDAGEAFNWYGAEISADGGTAVVNGKFHLYVVNVATGELLWDEPTYNTECQIAISGDGLFFVTGSLTGRLRLFHRDGQFFEELWHYTFQVANSSWVSSVGISRDGSTIGAGTLDFFDNHYEGRYAIFDTYGRGAPIWMSEPLADEVSTIRFSNDGSIFAVGSWGDVGNEQPDVFVHEKHNSNPFYSLTTDGSISGVSISGAGHRIVVGGKATHNRVFGRGGQVHMIALSLLGGFASGRVIDARNNGITGATISAENNPYTALTDASGRYTLRLETDEEAHFNFLASKRGVGETSRGAVVSPDDTTQNVNFTIPDGLVDAPPVNLRASRNTRNHIELTWDAYNGRVRRMLNDGGEEILSAVGDHPAKRGVTPWDEEIEGSDSPPRDDPDDAIFINIYRSPVSGGPYTYIGRNFGWVDSYIDRDGLFPTHRYYYRIAAEFERGESEFSDEVVGWIYDDFLIWDADLEPFQQAPEIDGEIRENEWAGAEFRDISDVIGYDAPDSAGTVDAWIGFSDVDDRLYIAARYHSIDEVTEGTGLGVYVDDDGNGAWTSRRDGSEGNYWGYEREGVPDMRFRSLSGGAYVSEPFYRFANPTLAYSESERGVEFEMSIPLGFHGPEEIAVYAPDQTIGLGIFAMSRDAQELPIFHGWWPQDMFSIVSQPDQFAQVHIPVTLTVPPVSPNEFRVSRERGGLLLTWRDPAMGIDSAALGEWDGVNIYRNGEFLTSVEPGIEGYSDHDFRGDGGDWGGWFEYSLSGYVLEDDGPFEGPRSSNIGAFLGVEPDIEELRGDDGTAEAYYVVAFDGNDNRFAKKFEVEAGEEILSIYWIDIVHRGTQSLDIWCTADDNGFPAEGGNHYRVNSVVADGITRFYFPGREQPQFELDPDFSGSFWVVLKYLAETPNAPAIGVDASIQNGEENAFYTPATGWASFGAGQLMIRAGAGAPVADVGGPDIQLPLEFEVFASYPNPFNSSTKIPIGLPTAGNVSLQIMDLQGRVYRQDELGSFSAGRHYLTVEAGDLSSGIYLALVNFGGQKRRVIVFLIK